MEKEEEEKPKASSPTEMEKKDDEVTMAPNPSSASLSSIYKYSKKQMIDIMFCQGYPRPDYLPEDYFNLKSGLFDPEQWLQAVWVQEGYIIPNKQKQLDRLKAESQQEGAVVLSPQRKSFGSGCRRPTSPRNPHKQIEPRPAVSSSSQEPNPPPQTSVSVSDGNFDAGGGGYGQGGRRVGRGGGMAIPNRRFSGREDERGGDSWGDKASNYSWRDNMSGGPVAGSWRNRGDSGGFQPTYRQSRDSRGGRHGGYENGNRYGGGYGRQEEAPMPEWMDDGPGSMMDTIELRGFEEDEKYGSESHRSQRSNQREDYGVRDSLSSYQFGPNAITSASHAAAIATSNAVSMTTSSGGTAEEIDRQQQERMMREQFQQQSMTTTTQAAQQRGGGEGSRSSSRGRRSGAQFRSGSSSPASSRPHSRRNEGAELFGHPFQGGLFDMGAMGDMDYASMLGLSPSQLGNFPLMFPSSGQQSTVAPQKTQTDQQSRFSKFFGSAPSPGYSAPSDTNNNSDQIREQRQKEAAEEQSRRIFQKLLTGAGGGDAGDMHQPGGGVNLGGPRAPPPGAALSLAEIEQRLLAQNQQNAPNPDNDRNLQEEQQLNFNEKMKEQSARDTYPVPSHQQTENLPPRQVSGWQQAKGNPLGDPGQHAHLMDMLRKLQVNQQNDNVDVSSNQMRPDRLPGHNFSSGPPPPHLNLPPQHPQQPPFPGAPPRSNRTPSPVAFPPNPAAIAAMATALAGKQGVPPQQLMQNPAFLAGMMALMQQQNQQQQQQRFPIGGASMGRAGMGPGSSGPPRVPPFTPADGAVAAQQLMQMKIMAAALQQQQQTGQSIPNRNQQKLSPGGGQPNQFQQQPQGPHPDDRGRGSPTRDEGGGMFMPTAVMKQIHQNKREGDVEEMGGGGGRAILRQPSPIPVCSSNNLHQFPPTSGGGSTEASARAQQQYLAMMASMGGLPRFPPGPPGGPPLPPPPFDPRFMRPPMDPMSINIMRAQAMQNQHMAMMQAAVAKGDMNTAQAIRHRFALLQQHMAQSFGPNAGGALTRPPRVPSPPMRPPMHPSGMPPSTMGGYSGPNPMNSNQNQHESFTGPGSSMFGGGGGVGGGGHGFSQGFGPGFGGPGPGGSGQGQMGGGGGASFQSSSGSTNGPVTSGSGLGGFVGSKTGSGGLPAVMDPSDPLSKLFGERPMRAGQLPPWAKPISVEELEKGEHGKASLVRE